MDAGSFPTWNWILSVVLTSGMMYWNLKEIPTDPTIPQSSNIYSWLSFSIGWEYGYQPIKRGWILSWWFVLMAKTETAWWSNYVHCTASANLSGWTELYDLNICTSVTKGATCIQATSSSSSCYYSDPTELRYIYKN
jgi:hypothetical protein